MFIFKARNGLEPLYSSAMLSLHNQPTDFLAPRWLLEQLQSNTEKKKIQHLLNKKTTSIIKNLFVWAVNASVFFFRMYFLFKPAARGAAFNCSVGGNNNAADSRQSHYHPNKESLLSLLQRHYALLVYFSQKWWNPWRWRSPCAAIQ